MHPTAPLPASWAGAPAFVEHSLTGVSHRLDDHKIAAAITAWSELAQWLDAVYGELGPLPPADPDFAAYREAIIAIAQSGRQIAAALESMTFPERAQAFSASPYRREENFQAHCEGIGDYARGLQPLEPDVEAGLREVFESEAPAADPFETDGL
ncbi:MAG: hypothetical protein PHE83_18590, partial [Opitutaceae bacterium]|nr:hypothetical protein [Opitutaceae bacterium]